MRTQLFIENFEVELNDDVQFLLNKQFEELDNPTVICNDWSKTVSIPFTEANNRLFGYLYRPDKLTISDAYNPNIYKQMHIYFDPTKKLDFRLVYNSMVLMEGYAKVNDIVRNGNKGSYNITLNGQLGKVFQEMKKITFDESTAYTDYLINGSEYVNTSINAQTVYDSWTAAEQHSNLLKKTTDSNYYLTDIIGFAPNNAFCEGFNYSVFQDSEISSKAFTEVLGDSFKEDTGIDGETVIPDGLLPREIGEYRSYLQLPFIYFNKLFQIFQAKAEEVTGYEFELDSDWFNPLNPYWYNLVYMLKSFNPKLGDEGIAIYTADMVVSGSTDVPAKYVWWNWDGHCLLDLYNMNRTSGSINPYLPGTNTFNVDDDGANAAKLYFKPSFRVKYNSSATATAENPKLRIQMPLVFDFVVTGSNSYAEKKRVVIKSDYVPSSYDSFIDTADIVITENEGPQNSVPSDNTSYEYKWNMFFPDLIIDEDTFGSSYSINVDNYFYRDGSTGYPLMFTDSFTYPERVSSCTTNVEGGETTVNINILNKQYHSGDNFTLNTLWNNDYNVFDEIIKYCKIFRIGIQADSFNKKIIFKPYTKYFQNYTIEKWDEKLDMSKDFTIKPITFENKYVLFNYNENKTKLAGDYKEKYGVNYGEYRLVTDYNFNTETKKLFDKVNCPITNTDNVLSWTTIFDNHKIFYSFPAEIYVYNKDADKKQVDLFGSYYFHNGLAEFSTELGLNLRAVKLSDDTIFQSVNNTYFYTQDADDTITVTTYPKLDVVNGSNLCLFNIPNENYTYLNNYSGKHSIYSNLWNEYINERYNIQNKQITCYVMLEPKDYSSFQWNKFVMIGNVICMVNNIYDYDVTSNEPTKVDLITIQDVTGYTTNDYDDSEVVSGSIRFKSLQDGSQIGLTQLNSNQTLEYSMNGTDNWTSFTTADTITLNTNEKVYVRGKLSSGSGSTQFNITGKVSVKGDLENIWNWEGSSTMYQYCGDHLFADCAGLVDASGLKINKINANYGLRDAFEGCYNLILPPVITAMYIAQYGCYGMFRNCTKLLYAPELPATSVLSSAYMYMFQGCNQMIKTPSVLPATYVQANCYSNMFEGCTSIESMPEFKSTRVYENGCKYMFQNCSSLKHLTLLPATNIQAASVYYSMFENCTSITSIPEGFLPATTVNDYGYTNMFKGCTSLTTVPENLLPATTLKQSAYAGMFNGCTSLTNAPKLSTSPLPTNANSVYSNMFKDCTSLTTPPVLPSTTLTYSCYYGMFEGCTSLTSVPTLPATTLKPYCYNNMFKGCTNIVEAPELYASTLVEQCYSGMFDGCTKLEHIKCMATSLPSGYWTTYQWVKNVANDGIFEYDANSTIWTTGDNGIPNGWTTVPL